MALVEINGILRKAREHHASDVHIVVGAPVLMRIDGELRPASRDVLSPEVAKHLSYSLLNKKQQAYFEENCDYDLMVADTNRCRYRVNIAYNDGFVGCTIRLLPSDPIKLEQIKMPEIVRMMTRARKGLILITGSTSQGKSTTMAAMIDEINSTTSKHIITIEDPIEYVHKNNKSVIRQRDVGKDTKSFHNGLRAALRQDPDVILLGEMRDYETIKTALTAAETGILVISTLHIISIDKIIERMLAYAPDGSDGHMRALLAESLFGVIHQELLPTVDGGKRVACEVLLVTDAVRNVLRNRDTFHLRNQIATGKKFGMVTMTSSLTQLLEEGVISEEVYDSVAESYS